MIAGSSSCNHPQIITGDVQVLKRDRSEPVLESDPEGGVGQLDNLVATVDIIAVGTALGGHL
ncbi:hypothetical protein NJ7G_1767 [Natrinema sp. J7-2]|nr:hypothetical protein NJ7G_1767 [Natrinema sp. J7-2]